MDSYNHRLQSTTSFYGYYPGCYINSSYTGWNLDLLYMFFDAVIVSEIKKIPVHQSSRSDRLLWLPAKNGDFSVKSAYKLLTTTNDTENEVLSPLEWKAFWKLQIHSRHKLLFWKFRWNALPTASRIATAISHTSNINTDEICPLCNSSNEDAHHLLLSCDLVKKLWRSSPWPIQLEALQHLGPTGWIKSSSSSSTSGLRLPPFSTFCRGPVRPHLDDQKRL